MTFVRQTKMKKKKKKKKKMLVLPDSPALFAMTVRLFGNDQNMSFFSVALSKY